MLLCGNQELPDDQFIEFVASKSGTGVNFFGESSIPDDTYYEVNGVRQNEPINNLTFSENDVINIVYRTAVYSVFSCNNQDYLGLIKRGRIPKVSSTSFERCFYNCKSLTSIPEGLFDKNPLATDFSGCFYLCSNLTSIPEGLFDKNTQATDFGSCFNNCGNLTSIPEGLFDKNPLATDFGSCFSYCRSLTSIPKGLFDKNKLATNFNFCFNDCRSLTPVVQIGSTSTSEIRVTYFGNGTASKGTVYCRAGSAAYTAFSSSTNANVNVLTY